MVGRWALVAISGSYSIHAAWVVELLLEVNRVVEA